MNKKRPIKSTLDGLCRRAKRAVNGANSGAMRIGTIAELHVDTVVLLHFCPQRGKAI